MSSIFAVPIAYEGAQDKLIKQLIELDFVDTGSFCYDKTGEPIAVLIYSISKAFMVYRGWVEIKEEMIQSCFMETQKISMGQALKKFRRK